MGLREKGEKLEISYPLKDTSGRDSVPSSWMPCNLWQFHPERGLGVRSTCWFVLRRWRCLWLVRSGADYLLEVSRPRGAYLLGYLDSTQFCGRITRGADHGPKLVVGTQTGSLPMPSFEKRLLTSKKTLDVKLEHIGGLASGVDLSSIPLSTLYNTD